MSSYGRRHEEIQDRIKVKKECGFSESTKWEMTLEGRLRLQHDETSCAIARGFHLGIDQSKYAGGCMVYHFISSGYEEFGHEISFDKFVKSYADFLFEELNLGMW